MLCSFCFTRNEPIRQAIYVCSTCRENDDECCCSHCSKICHRNCKVHFVGFGSAFCDCGSTCTIRGTSPTDVGSPINRADTENYNIRDSHSLSRSMESFSMSFDSGNLTLLESQAVEIATTSKQTFWIGYNHAPRCDLERLAHMILRVHVSSVISSGESIHVNSCGAEWWVQTKSPGCGIDLHYDKDEELAETYGIGIFPAISTVTYLSDTADSLPTIVFDTTAEDPVGSPIRKIFLSRPMRGKHIAFDGRMLHGAPAIFESEGDPPTDEVEALKKNKKKYAKVSIIDVDNEATLNRCVKSAESSEVTASELNAPPTPLPSRVTFLVNVWVGHRPALIDPLPDRIVDLLNTVGGGSCDEDTEASGQLLRIDARSVVVSDSHTRRPRRLLRGKMNKRIKTEENREEGHVSKVDDFEDHTQSPAPQVMPQAADTSCCARGGRWGETPFLSDKAAWGKAEDEVGVNMRYWKPEEGWLSEDGASYAIEYTSKESSARLHYTKDA